MQILFEHSSESDIDCLGLIPGTVNRLQAASGIRVPHMGWNAVNSCRDHPLLEGLDGKDFYFVHSYAAMPSDASIALCEHGQDFSAAVASGKVLGVQFHPERSGPQGQRLLANFLGMAA
jgi:glutamine amidotransferase